MTYSKKILAKIGREVIDNHPELATAILGELPKPSSSPISKIPYFFIVYCTHIGIKPETLHGPVFKSTLTEAKKVFISAMIRIYSDQYLFKKTLTEVLGQPPSATSRMITEVEFRDKKDNDFIKKVDNILTKINSHDTGASN